MAQISRRHDGVRGHTIHRNHQHLSWDNSRPPALTVAPGDLVEFKDIDASSGQLTARSTVDDVVKLNLARVNPIAGPVYVDGAEPGDALKVSLIDFDASGWAWTAIIPGFGVLSQDFPDAALHVWSFDKSFSRPALYGSDARVPLKPFCGTIGVAPAERGSFAIKPPHSAGETWTSETLRGASISTCP